MFKWMKLSMVTAGAALLLGAVLFGTDLASYVKSSAGSVRSAVKESVPIEFELRRARDLLDEIIPQMHANVRLIAEEEVELAALKRDIADSAEALADERQRVARLHEMLQQERAGFTISGVRYSREQVRDDLARRFERIKEAEVVLAGKERLQETRERSLAAAVQMQQKIRGRKALLEDKIESLQSQHRLVQAAAAGSSVQLDSSKLAQTEKLIGQIRKRLDVAERVLAREAAFTQPIEIDVISEQELLAQVGDYLEGESASASAEADDEHRDAVPTVNDTSAVEGGEEPAPGSLVSRP